MRDKPIVYIAGCLDVMADQTLIFIAKTELESRGFAVIDNYDLPRNKGLMSVELRRFGNAALGVCDLVCFLSGWELNPSAVREHTLSRLWGRTTVDYEELLRRNDQMQDISDVQLDTVNRAGNVEAKNATRDN